MAAAPQAFYGLWQQDAIRERLFELLPRRDICALRLASSACCNLVTRRLFLRTHLTFTANSFTKPARIEALSRVGHHIEHLTFCLPHSDATFLPPLIHPRTGQEITFLYSPHTSVESALARPKYGSPELGEILTEQYPPLFHAATHVSSFIDAMRQMPNMRHLTVKTPGQDPRERYRRDIVDYALISLRIALERAPLTKLSKLSLSGVHPSAFNYLRHAPGFGASPSAALRWRQIRKLSIAVDAWDFYGPCPGLDHLKIIDDYIRAFAPRLEKFSFAWLGRRGPCPIALAADPLFAPPRGSRKLFHEITSPMSPLPPRPSRRPLVMPRLRSMTVRNATMNVPQLRGLIESHRDTVREFNFENVALVRGGSWDDALAPLTEGGRADAWSRRSFSSSSTSSSSSSNSAGSGGGDSRPGTSRSNWSGSPVASSLEDEQLPESSAAAEAASRELFEVDFEGVTFGGVKDVDAFEAGVEDWARGVTAVAQEGPRPNTAAQDDGGLTSDIEAAKQASQSFTAKLKKRRIRRKSRDSADRDTAEREDERRREDQKSDRSSSSRRRRRRHHYHARSRHNHSRSDDDESPRRRQSPPAPSPKLDISVPILNPDPLPVLLQPTTYDPSAKCGPLLGRRDDGDGSVSSREVKRERGRESKRMMKEEKEEEDDDGLSPAQRSIEADLRAEAEEAAARSTALRLAREAVITKLTREFSRQRSGHGRGRDKESAAAAAAVAGLSALDLDPNLPSAHQSGGLGCGQSSIGFRIRDGLFGRSMMASVGAAVVPDARGLESQTALVPLILSRS